MFYLSGLRFFAGLAFAFILIATLNISYAAASTVPVPRIGTYALKGSILSGGSCTEKQILPPFKYLYFVGRTSGSKFYYLGSPGSEAATISVPPYPKPGRVWKGIMTWSVNPVTFQPPSVVTHFELDTTVVDEQLILLSGDVHVPTADGGECDERVGYTGVLVSGTD